MDGLQATLGGGVLVQTATAGLGGQKLLVDDLVQDATEQFGLDVQRLALADQTLSHRFATHIRSPDRAVLNLGDDQIVFLRRRFRIAAPAGGRQRQGQKGRRQQGPHHFERGRESRIRRSGQKAKGGENRNREACRRKLL